MRMILTGPKRLVVENTGIAAEARPVPATGYVRRRVLCCAICRTDAKMWAQGHPDLVLPRVPGHEMVVADDRERRFAVWPGHSCGNCRHCRNGRENRCDRMKITGFDWDGGFAGQVVVPEKSLVPVPDTLPTPLACLAEPVGCVLHALETLSLKTGQRALIYGGGVMGLMASLAVKEAGSQPLIIEKSAAKIQKGAAFFRKTGLSAFAETGETEFDLLLNACPDSRALEQGLTRMARGGQVAFFSGLRPEQKMAARLFNLIHYRELTLTGSYGLTRKNLEAALLFLARHRRALEILIEAVVPPETAPKLMAAVLSGERYKYILDFTGNFLSTAVSEEP